MKVHKGGISLQPTHQGVAELGHELGNVLNGLLGMTRLVRDSGLNAEQERWLRAIEQSGLQMQWLVDAFRCEALPADQSAFHRPAEFDGIDLLEQSVLANAPSAQDGFNRLMLVAGPGLTRYWTCDPCLLRQVLDNLLGNALKFTRSGEVVLEAGASGGVGGWDDLWITVTDTGPGIDKTLGSRIFAPYEQGVASMPGQSGGRGLGLFIARRIVDAMGGTISWSSPAGGGTCFEVRLPGILGRTTPEGGGLPSGILRNMRCQVDLAGPLQRSVIGCLARLGVISGMPSAADGRVSGKRSLSGRGLRVVLSELPSNGEHPGPALQVRAQTATGEVIVSKPLQAPILECSLGPVLLETALEWLWIRNERSGSVP